MIRRRAPDAALKDTPALFGRAALSITSLQQAMIELMSQVDQDGEPISIEDMTLIYPPGSVSISMARKMPYRWYLDDVREVEDAAQAADTPAAAPPLPSETGGRQ